MVSASQTAYMDKLAEINANPHFLDSSLFMRQKTIIVGVNSASSTSLPVISRVSQRSIATVCTQGYGSGLFSLQARAPRRPRSIMMSPVVVNQDQLVSLVRCCLWSSLTACAITNCFAGNRLCARQITVQNEENPIFKSNFLPFCTELYYPRAIYCRTDGKVSIRRARGVGVALPKNVPKSKSAVNTIYQNTGTNFTI